MSRKNVIVFNEPRRKVSVVEDHARTRAVVVNHSRRNVTVVGDPSKQKTVLVTMAQRKVTVSDDPASRKIVVVKGVQSRLVAVSGSYIPRADISGAGNGNANSISGIPVELSNLQANNVLAYNGSKFINRAQELLTDGGNF